MKQRVLQAFIMLSMFTIISGCSNINGSIPNKHSSNAETKQLVYNQKDKPDSQNINKILEKYKGQIPYKWGEKVMGVKSELNTRQKVLALTFDACGGKNGSGYDKKLIEYLTKNNIPATLFINSRWIDSNYHTFISLSKNPLFEIENHGYLHKPLSVNGKSAYGISGTKNIKEIIDEVSLNEQKIYRLTGIKPRFFRPGTAYCDEVAVRVVNDLGMHIVGFNVLGDAGATYTKEQIKKACLSSKPGSIIIFHMNHPEKETAEGVRLVLPELIKRGFKFVKLSEFPLK